MDGQQLLARWKAGEDHRGQRSRATTGSSAGATLATRLLRLATDPAVETQENP